MNRSVVAAALLAFAIGAPSLGHAQDKPKMSPAEWIKQAVAAEGGAAALSGLKTLSIKADVQHWEPEQSMIAGGPPRPIANSTVTFSWDLDKGARSGNWDRDLKYPFPGHERYIEMVFPAMGAITDEKSGQRPMAGQRLAFQLREMERSSPLLLLKAMQMKGSIKGAAPQKMGGKSYPAVSVTDGANKFIILFDEQTHLPAAVRTVEDDDVHGDGHYDLILGDWKSVGGAKIAHSLHYTFNGLDKVTMQYKEVTPNGAFPPDAFLVGDAARSGARPPATGDIPWQAILVRLNFGRFDDIQAEKDAAEGTIMKLEAIAPNVQQIQGRSHNSLIVAMPTYLVVFDAPQNEDYAKKAIALAKQTFPGKPIKYLVLTHHHMDHIGGARTYVAEGATVIVGKDDKAHLEKDFRAPHTMHPDALQMQKPRRPAKVIEVADRMSLKDGGSEVQVFDIANAHAAGYLMGYVQPENVVWVTDLYSPGRDKAKTPNNEAFYNTVKKLGITVSKYAGGHGAWNTQTDFDAVIAGKS